MRVTRYDYRAADLRNLVFYTTPRRSWYYGDLWVAYNIWAALDWWEQALVQGII